MSLFTLEDVSISYGDDPVLRHVSMSLEPREIVTIVGPNGSGKTTLLRAIIGAIEPSSGRISRKPDLKIGYVPTLPITVDRFLA